MSEIKYNDYRISEEEIELLHKVLSKKLNLYRCDPFIFTPSVPDKVSFFIEDDIFQITNEWEYRDFYSGKEDMGILHFRKACLEDAQSDCYDAQTHKQIEQIDYCIEQVIREIHIINEHHHVIFSDGEFVNDITRGFIFKFDEFELSFEQDWEFSQEITIRRGDNLLSQFTPESDFVKSCREEEGEENCFAECKREIIILK